MKIQSLIANTTKSRLKLHSHWERGANSNKIKGNQKSILLISHLPNKQNHQKSSTQMPSQKQFNTFTEFPKNRKNSLTKSNSSVQKKLQREIKQKLCNFVCERGVSTPKGEYQEQSYLQAASKVYQKMFLKRIVWEGQQKTATLTKRDLLFIIALGLNPNISLETAQHLQFYARLAQKEQSYKTSKLQKRQQAFKICNLTSSISYIPQGRDKAWIVPSQWRQRQVQTHLNEHQGKIKQIRDSILSQQNLLTNIKNGPRSKHSSRLHPQDLQMFSQSNRQPPSAFEYVLEQNDLLMKIAGHQFKKYESQIFQYGLILQTKHLEIDYEYQQLTASQTDQSSTLLFKDSLQKIVLNPLTPSPQKYRLILDSFGVFHEQMQAKDSKLKKLIEVKSTFISEFSARMELWIQNLVYKKEFNDNLVKYIERENQYVKNTINSMANTLQKINQSSIAKRMEQLKKSLQQLCTAKTKILIFVLIYLY